MSIIDSILNVFLGDKGKKDVKEVTPIVNSVIKFEEELSKISNDQLRSITQEFKNEIKQLDIEIKKAEAKYSLINQKIKMVQEKFTVLRENKARLGATIEGIDQRKMDLVYMVKNELKIENINNLLSL